MHILLFFFRLSDTLHQYMATDPGSNAEDLEIIHLVLRGETGEFRKIIEKYHEMIFRLCSSFLKNTEEAEDAAQEIFLRAFKSIGTFQLEKRFATWLYTIGVNYLKKLYSKIKRFPEQNELQTELTAAESPGPGEIVEQREQQKEIRDAVHSLPHNIRDVTILYYLEEKSVEEITEIMEISRENVKSRLHRARKKLRKILEKTQPVDKNGGIQ